MYKSKEYFERPLEEIKSEIDFISSAGSFSRRVFLADGDALNLATDHLVQILRYIRVKLPVERVSSYAMPKNLLQKSQSELAHLKLEGLDMLYVGIESGNDAILKKVTKGATSRLIGDACEKAEASGLILSCMVILGLGGRKYTNEHISDTARILGEISPDYPAALSLRLRMGLTPSSWKNSESPFRRSAMASCWTSLSGL